MKIIVPEGLVPEIFIELGAGSQSYCYQDQGQEKSHEGKIKMRMYK
jgi:hypothetical protein